MEKEAHLHLSFEIDQLTDSIVNAFSGDRFDTEVRLCTTADFKGVTKKLGWQFNWRSEVSNHNRMVSKLTIVNNPIVIQGLICIETMPDHVYMHLLESAPFNIGAGKVYIGVPGNLVAYACHQSFLLGFDGNIAFTAKTKLIQHYQKTLGAIHVGGHTMIIESAAAAKLIAKYFKNDSK